MTVARGSVYWGMLEAADDGRVGVAHPQVVVEVRGGDEVLVCAVTTNAKKFNMPGNVVLEPGEANLPRRSAVEVGKSTVLAVAALGEYIGALPEERVAQIVAGMQFVRRSFLER